MLMVRAVRRASGDTLEAPERPRLGVCCDALWSVSGRVRARGRAL